MPTYSYACKNCGHEFNVQQSFNEATLTECPECKGPLRKVFGQVGVTFKGSGFYKTDNATSKKSD
jgi:putative FmdB family regulatory protein